MLKPITTKSVIRHVPAQDDGGPESVLLLKPWPKRVYAAILDCIHKHTPVRRSGDDDDGKVMLGDVPNRLVVDAVRCGLVGYENVLDDEGNPVQVGDRKEGPAFFGEVVEMIPEQAINPLPFAVVQAAFFQLLLECRLSEGDRKNS